MVVWLSINSIFIALILLVLYLVIRQIGVILSYVGPVGARQLEGGPRIGENISSALTSLGLGQTSMPTLLVFGSQACSVCKAVRRACEDLCGVWRDTAQIILLYDEDLARKDNSDADGDGRPKMLGGTDLRLRLDIGTIPFAVALDGTANVLGKGLVNTTGHVESLLELIREKCPRKDVARRPLKDLTRNEYA